VEIKRAYYRRGLIIIAFLGVLFLISYYAIEKWRGQTIERNSALCKEIALELLDASKEKIEYLVDKDCFENEDIGTQRLKAIDSTLTILTNNLLSSHKGFEGGFFISHINQFAGYSYPTSEPPKPVYGPPPRSYNIIKEQCLKSISQGKLISGLHGFDPAVFPLVTVPVRNNDDVVGAIWVRKHIERELPLVKLQNVINVAFIFLIISVIILLWFSYSLRLNIQSIRNDLQIVHQDSNFRLQNRGRLFTGIIKSINKTLESLHLENYEKRRLEKKLLQKEKMASIGRVVAGVAHEVRTPLAIIKTRMQMWQKSLNEGNKRNAAQKFITEDSIKLVVNETDRLSNLIKRLLIYSKPINKSFVKTNIWDLIKETIRLVQIQKDNPDIDFNMVEKEVPEIMVEKNSLQQVFINVFSNSVEAMPKGGTINIKIETINNHIVIEIEDEGVGIPFEIFENIFEPFVTSKTSGVGLGLSISYEIIKAHNGEIQFENLKYGGVKCTIKLPLTTK